jgi:hypothetical protein
MDSISIRYGESVTLPLDTGDVLSVSADIYIGKPGQVYILTKHITLTEGKGTFEISGVETQIPLDTYYYQVNVTDSTGKVDKYPAPEAGCGDCENNFPKFIVAEALDLTEVS